jgi:hypothetical protein
MTPISVPRRTDRVRPVAMSSGMVLRMLRASPSAALAPAAAREDKAAALGALAPVRAADAAIRERTVILDLRGTAGPPAVTACAREAL